MVADLTQPLPIDEPIDAILSTATFHWIADHDSLFHGLAQVLRRGGQLAAQCGGAGNITSIEAALRDLGQDARGRKHYATVEATRNRLLAAGFDDIETWLHDEPKRFVHEVAVRLPGPHIDYVRLNIRARRT